MRNLLCGTTLAAGLILAGGAARAGVTDTFCGPSSGMGCEAGTELMVYLNDAKDVTSGTGRVGSPTSTTLLNLSSDGGMLQIFLDLSNGFATITPTHGASTFNGIDITIPGFTFTDLVFDTQLTPTASPTDSFTVEGFSGAHSDGKGTETEAADTDKEYAITAVGGAFDEVNILSLTGFDEIKHIEVSGLAPVVTAVPEPATMGLLGIGLIGLLGVGRRRA
jgi:hypothetical protein